MYFVYDLRQDGFVVYTGLTDDLGRSLNRHLVRGKAFDSLHLVDSLTRLEDARLAAQRRRYMLSPTRNAHRTPTGQHGGPPAPLR